jgi:hypothetical protein
MVWATLGNSRLSSTRSVKRIGTDKYDIIESRRVPTTCSERRLETEEATRSCKAIRLWCSPSNRARGYKIHHVASNLSSGGVGVQVLLTVLTRYTTDIGYD